MNISRRAKKLESKGLGLFHSIIDKLERANAHHEVVVTTQHQVADKARATAFAARDSIQANEKVLGKLTDLVGV